MGAGPKHTKNAKRKRGLGGPRGRSKLSGRSADVAVFDLSDADVSFVRGLLTYEDDVVLVFDKPSGLPVQTRDVNDRTLDRLLWAFAKSNGKRPRLVHRLDAQTSGVIVAARTQPAAAVLSEGFAKRQMKKGYIALVTGRGPDGERGRIDAPLVRYRLKPELELMRVARPGDDSPQAAQTDWQVIGRAGDACLLSLMPKTGRMHQLRAHLASVGWPIVGDPYYGGKSAFAGKPVERMMLHAAELSGPHPDGSRFVYQAPLPDAFLKIWSDLGGDMAIFDM